MVVNSFISNAKQKIDQFSRVLCSVQYGEMHDQMGTVYFFSVLFFFVLLSVFRHRSSSNFPRKSIFTNIGHKTAIKYSSVNNA